MSELVTVIPRAGKDSKGDPLPAPGAPFPLTALEVAPGNTLLAFGIGGDLDSCAFSVFLPLSDKGKVLDNYGITVRGHECWARVQLWESGGRGAVVVLASSSTGKAG